MFFASTGVSALASTFGSSALSGEAAARGDMASTNDGQLETNGIEAPSAQIL
mgnify:CR=1 FL=1